MSKEPVFKTCLMKAGLSLYKVELLNGLNLQVCIFR